jgi:AcrR family transcriptional regulator
MPQAGQEIERAPIQRPPRRLSKADWLEASMQILDAEGVGSLTIEHLTSRLGVTQGSFYWHFKSHAQFLRELMAMWAQEETFSVGEALASLDLPPRDMLREVMRIVTELDRAHLEMKFRHLVASNPFLQEQLREVDHYRYRLAEGLFRQLGFKGKKLRARTHAFVVLVSLEYGLTEPMNKKERLGLLDERLALFVD